MLTVVGPVLALLLLLINIGINMYFRQTVNRASLFDSVYFAQVFAETKMAMSKFYEVRVTVGGAFRA